MNILAILQARYSSSRLPGKVLLPILQKPMLALQIERMQRAKHIDHIVVATSVQSSDTSIAELCENRGISCFRGSLEDVLDRFYQAAKAWQPDHVVRLTGDCPLIDPMVMDAAIEYHLQGHFDYTTNALEPTYPDGLDVEIIRFAALQTAWEEAKLPSQREHVTPFIYNEPARFKIGHLKNSVNLAGLRWTVDRPDDFALITRIYEALYPSNPAFTTADILEFLNQHPALKTMNVSHPRNEGLKKSLQADEEYLRNHHDSL